ncbi:MAG: hypothetical protein ACI87E_001629 [Mariniblastus sp.]|jgi:hypothetical protein
MAITHRDPPTLLEANQSQPSTFAGPPFAEEKRSLSFTVGALNQSCSTFQVPHRAIATLQRSRFSIWIFAETSTLFDSEICYHFEPAFLLMPELKTV